MKLVIETTTNRAIYLFEDGATVEITPEGMTKPLAATDIRPDTHSVIEGVAPPPTWAGNAYTYDAGVWTVVNQDAVDAALERAKQAKRAALKAEFAKARDSGVDFNGVTVQTTPQAQSEVQALFADLQRRAATETDPVQLIATRSGAVINADEATAGAIVDAVAAHIRAVWSNDATLTASINDAASIADLEAIDVMAGWPS